MLFSRALLLPTLSAALIAFAASSCGGKRARTARPPRIGTSQTGIASWYGPPYHGRRAANGEIYDMERFTAAHRTFAFDTWVRVRNLDNGREVDVRITDRGPFVRGRVIDLSKAAARQIGMIGPGVAKVKLKVIDQGQAATPAPVKPPVGPPEPPPPPPPITSDTFGVQVGAFRDQDRASKLQTALREKYGHADLVVREGDAPTWRVIVGVYADEALALTAASLLRQDFPEAFVVRRDTASVP